MRQIRKMDIQTNKDLQIQGRAITFNEVTEIREGNNTYKEIILDTALNNTDFSECMLFYNHDMGQVPLAKVGETMKLQVTPKGLEIEATLPNTEKGKEIYTAIQRKDLSGMSFSFTVAENGEYFDPETNTRIIKDIDKVYEVSIVPYPAYPTTSLQARAKALRNDNKALDDLKIRLNKLKLKRRI